MPYSFLDLAVLHRVEQAERRLVHRRALDGIEGHVFHQLLEALGDGALATAHRAQQIQDLLLLLQPLRGMPEVRHHLFDGVLHAIELLEGRIELDHLVGEDAREAGVVACVDQLGIADGPEHAFGSGGVGEWVALAEIQILLQRDDLFSRAVVTGGKVADHVHGNTSIESMRRKPRSAAAGPSHPESVFREDCMPVLRFSIKQRSHP